LHLDRTASIIHVKADARDVVNVEADFSIGDIFGEVFSCTGACHVQGAVGLRLGAAIIVGECGLKTPEMPLVVVSTIRSAPENAGESS